MPEFSALTAQLTNIDLWLLLWLLHNALYQVFLLFCLQSKNSFFNKKIQKCLWRVWAHEHHCCVADVQASLAHMVHGLQLFGLMRVQCSPCFLLLRDACNRALDLPLPLQASSLCHHVCTLLLGEPWRRGGKALNMLSEWLVYFPRCSHGWRSSTLHVPASSPWSQLLNPALAVCSWKSALPCCLSWALFCFISVLLPRGSLCCQTAPSHFPFAPTPTSPAGGFSSCIHPGAPCFLPTCLPSPLLPVTCSLFPGQKRIPISWHR